MNNTSSRLQSGMATIITSVTMLILITMVIVFSANVSVMETKTGANDYRATQAMLSAQAGLDFALTNLSKADLTDIAETAIEITEGDNTITTGYYTVTVDDTDPDNVILTSNGLSADRSSTATVNQKLLFASALRGDATNFIVSPIIVTGTASDLTLANITRNLAPAKIWSGGAVSGTGIPSTASGKLVDKIFENDPGASDPMSKLFPPKMMEEENLALKHMSIRQSCTASSCENPTEMIEESGYSKMHYVEGDLVLKNVTVGTTENPVVIIVEDSTNFMIRNNTVINGILIINGDWDNNNKSATVNGSIIVNGSTTDIQNINVNYDATVLNNMSRVGNYARLPGSWSDV